MLVSILDCASVADVLVPLALQNRLRGDRSDLLCQRFLRVEEDEPGNSQRPSALAARKWVVRWKAANQETARERPRNQGKDQVGALERRAIFATTSLGSRIGHALFLPPMVLLINNYNRQFEKCDLYNRISLSSSKGCPRSSRYSQKPRKQTLEFPLYLLLKVLPVVGARLLQASYLRHSELTEQLSCRSRLFSFSP